MVPDKALKKFERNLALMFALPIVVMIAFVLAFSIYQSHQNASSAEAASMLLCKESNTARTDNNRHVRRPLRATDAEIATILRKAAATERREQRDATLALVAKFDTYAAQVPELPLLQCGNPHR